MTFKKKKTTENEVFVLTLPLEPTQNQKILLDNYFRAALMIEHHLMAAELKKLKQMERTVAWKALTKNIAASYTEVKNAKTDADAAVALAAQQELFDQRNKLLSSLGFSDADFQTAAKKHQHVFHSLVHSQVVQKIASRVWKTFKDYLFSNGKAICFTPWSEFFSIAGKSNTTGLRYCASDRSLIVKKDHIRVSFHPKDKYGYETEAMKRNIRFCGIVRRWYPSGWKYFAQITLSGKPPLKVNPNTGEVLHALDKGNVGNDIGPQTLATVADTAVRLSVLAENVELPYKEIRRIQRAIDRSRRCSNPKMFNDNGEIIPINKLPPECLTPDRKHRKWAKSNNCLRLESRLRYLYQKIALQRMQSHNELTNQLLPLGDKHYIEHMNWRALAKRRKEDKFSEKGKHTSKKRFGKSIANKAPAKFVLTYRRKVELAGGQFFEINTAKAKASQYNHMDHTYKKKKLSQRWNNLPNGDHIQRDLYSAFLIQNTNNTLDGFDNAELDSKYSKFKALHDMEIERLRHIWMPSSVGVKHAV